MSYTERDWLFLESWQAGPTAMLVDFLDGKPMDHTEVRNAVVQIVLNGTDSGRKLVAILFDPTLKPKEFEKPVWTVDFRRTSKAAHRNPIGHRNVALAIQARLDCGKSSKEAVNDLVEQLGLSERQVRRIYKKYKGLLTSDD
jgi:hypothetical protein